MKHISSQTELALLFVIAVAQRYSAWLQAGRSGIQVPAGAGNFSLHHRAQNGSGTHPAPIQWVPESPSLGVKRPGREADRSPSISAEINNAWRYTSTPPIRLHGMVPIKDQGFYLYLGKQSYANFTVRHGTRATC
jgi:hypothetical protein